MSRRIRILVFTFLFLVPLTMALAQEAPPVNAIENPLTPYLGSLGFLAMYAAQLGLFVGVLSWLVTEGLVRFLANLPREKTAPLVALVLAVVAHASGKIVAPGTWDAYIWAPMLGFIAGGMGSRLFGNTIGNWFLSSKSNDISYGAPPSKS